MPFGCEFVIQLLFATLIAYLSFGFSPLAVLVAQAAGGRDVSRAQHSEHQLHKPDHPRQVAHPPPRLRPAQRRGELR